MPLCSYFSRIFQKTKHLKSGTQSNWTSSHHKLHVTAAPSTWQIKLYLLKTYWVFYIPSSPPGPHLGLSKFEDLSNSTNKTLQAEDYPVVMHFLPFSKVDTFLWNQISHSQAWLICMFITTVHTCQLKNRAPLGTYGRNCALLGHTRLSTWERVNWHSEYPDMDGSGYPSVTGCTMTCTCIPGISHNGLFQLRSSEMEAVNCVVWSLDNYPWRWTAIEHRWCDQLASTVEHLVCDQLMIFVLRNIVPPTYEGTS